MKIELKNNKLCAKTDLSEREVLCKLYERINHTGFSDIDYKPATLCVAVEHENLNPNCGIVQSDNGDLLLMTVKSVPKGDALTANFENSRYLKNKKKNKPNPDNKTLDRMTDLDHLNMVRINDNKKE